MAPPGQTVMAVAVTPLRETVLAVTALTRVSVPWVSGKDQYWAAAPHDWLTSVELKCCRTDFRSRSL